MTVLAYGVAGWILLVGVFGIVRSRNLIHATVSLAVAQSGTYVLLLTIGYQRHSQAPVFGSTGKPKSASSAVDPVVQAMTLTDIVVSATVTALLLAMTMQIHKRRGSIDPDELTGLRG